MYARLVTCSLLTAFALAAAPTPPAEYEVLTGEDLAGSGFVIRHQGEFLGVCSIHQFDGGVPGELTPLLDGEAVKLDKSRVVKQQDVQVLPVVSPADGLPFLEYRPDFKLAPGDAVIVLGPAGDVVRGTLTATGMRRGGYDAAAGPATLELRTDKPFVAAGGSGGPVILQGSGAVVGVLLTADDPRAARTVGFETLCLDNNTTGGAVGVRRRPFSYCLGMAVGTAFGFLAVHAVLGLVIGLPVAGLISLARRRVG